MKAKTFTRMLALCMASAMLFTSPGTALAAQNTAILDEPVAAAETDSIAFTSEYPAVGKALGVTVTGLTGTPSYQWKVGETVKSTNSTYTPSKSDLEQFITVTVTDSAKKSLSKTVFFSKLPVVYIDTKNVPIVDKENYVDCQFTIQGNEEYNTTVKNTTLYDGKAGIRGRGNSTWSLPKKPYKVKLDKKTDLFGFGKSKHWVLLANYNDTTFMRNKLSYDLSGKLGVPYMQSVLTDVVLNGEYVGNYQLCEQIKADKSRVDILNWEDEAEDAAAAIAEEKSLNSDDEDALAEQMTADFGWVTSKKVTYNGTTYTIPDTYKIPDIDGGYLLEMDEYMDEASTFETEKKQPMMFKEPEFVKTNDAMMNYVKNYIQAFENAVNADDYSASYNNTRKHYSELFDMQSMVDNWLVQEIFFNEDYMKKSTYMYKQNGQLFKMGPIWDMDWTSGATQSSATAYDQWQTLYFSMNRQNDQWNKELVKDPYFLREIYNRYWEVRDTYIQEMVDSIDTIKEEIRESAEASLKKWGLESFDTGVSRFKTWLTNHLKWMDSKMSTYQTFESEFIKSGTELNMTVTNSDKTALNADITGFKGAYEGLTQAKKALKVSFRDLENVSKIVVLADGKKLGEVSVSGSSAEYDIASGLTENTVLQAYGYNTSGAVTGTADIGIRVIEGDIPTVSSIEIKTLPSKTEYLIGEKIRLDGIVVWATYSDGQTSKVAAEDLTVEGYDPNQEGEQTVTVKYAGKSADFKVTVVAKTKVEIDQTVLEKNAKANSYQDPAENNDGPASYAFNGNTGDWWHSRWKGDAQTAKGEAADGNVSDTNYIWIQTGFDAVKEIYSITYQGRTDTGNNLVGEYDLQTAKLSNPLAEPADKDFTTVKSGSLTATMDEQEIILDKPVEATHIRLVAKSVISVDVNNYSKHVAASEIKVYEMGVPPKQPSESAAITFTKEYPVVGEAFGAEVTDMTGKLTYAWTVNGQLKGSGDSYTPKAEDLENFIELTVTDEEGAKLSKKVFFSKLPVLYLETENHKEIISKEDYVDASFTMQGNAQYNKAKGTTLYDGTTKIRGRGNTTWGLPKKPYKLKLDKSTDILGFGKSKHWVLLANYYDTTNMRNKLSYDLSGAMGIPYMQSILTDVILNGKYVGNYQFCEQIKISKDRVDITNWEDEAEDAAAAIVEAEGLSADDEDALGGQMTEDLAWVTSDKVTYNGTTYTVSKYYTVPEIDGGYLLEMDENFDEASEFKTQKSQPVMFKEPEFAATNKDMMNYVQGYIQAFEDAVNSPDFSTTYEGETKRYDELFDMQSLVDNWIVQEIFFNEDFMKKSSYMYKKSGELFKMGPIWDMDWSSGAAQSAARPYDQWQTLFFSANAQNDQWYKKIVRDPKFLKSVYDRYHEVRDTLIQDMLDSIDTIAAEIDESANASLKVWDQQQPYTDVVNTFKTWMTNRMNWLDGKFKTYETFEKDFTKDPDPGTDPDPGKDPDPGTDPENPIPLTGISVTPAETKLLIGETVKLSVSYTPENTTDAKEVKWSSSNEKVASVDAEGNVKALMPGKADITADVNGKTAVCSLSVKGVENLYKDITDKDWYYNAANWAYANNVMKGYSNGNFGGSDMLTRGQFALILYRIEGSPKTTFAEVFPDVREADYFAKAVIWANKNHIITGYGDTKTFGPDDEITREQLAAIMYRYARYKNYDTSKREKLDGFPDALSVSDYAKTAVQWCVAQGIISGKGESVKTLTPQGGSSRAEASTIIMRFQQKYGEAR